MDDNTCPHCSRSTVSSTCPVCFNDTLCLKCGCYLGCRVRYDESLEEWVADE